ncbi:molybdate ABC transporter substrate-binding protein [Flagellimonas myxillae]|uniref:molybdate ABC transporter substrate-binding protein n=1 Tax=Flagellimonas myxillae TaxID=2942214 RepID=UPI00201F17CC|nr:molybdate ABC transporter substrate-binding protein [Muricauda myxillae]MCL6265737.1 molybdate ABC transporter substrate-binding protein [Muricauda myxillae]
MFRISYLLWVLLLFSQLGCNPSSKSQRLTLAVSSNMQFSIEEIAARFTATTGIECDLVVASSGKLTAQIMEGAPFDVLLSADMKYPQMLFQNGMAPAAPKVYAYGQLVLYSPNANTDPKMEMLLKDSIVHIALANPKTAPYGSAAMEVLEHHAMLDSVRHKLVYGENVSQTNQFMVTGAAQIGFTAKSTVFTPSMANQGNWLALDSNSYTPIAQGIVMVGTKTKEHQKAEAFYNFIFSDESQKILKKYGYSVNE